MKEIQANAPTPEEVMELVRENERLKKYSEQQEEMVCFWRNMARSWHRDFKQLENKTND
jgi:hypothetical protein